MAETQTRQSELAARELTIVDVDSHVSNSIENLLPYMDQSVRSVIDRVPLEEVQWKIFSQSRATPDFPNNTGIGDDNELLEHEYATDTETKLRYMDEFNLDYSVLTPGILGLASVNHDQIAVEIARAHNEWMANAFFDESDRLKSVILIANQRPEKAAEEIDRWAEEDDVVGVSLPASGLVPPAGHHWYDPIYEAAEDHGLPIIMHTGNSTSTAAFPVQRHWSQTFTEDHLFTFPVEAMWHLGSIMFRGIPERYPDLRFVMEECGVEWLPWMRWRMNDHYMQNSVDVPILERMPSEYLYENFTFSTQPLGHSETPRDLAEIIRIAGGSDTIMFSTDHPHADFDPPEELLHSIKSHLDEDDVRGIMGETAMEIFDL
jgi:predicted TIM-barrel fold metal-dependent hydrolase